jgi:hypothetical protein
MPSLPIPSESSRTLALYTFSFQTTFSSSCRVRWLESCGGRIGKDVEGNNRNLFVRYDSRDYGKPRIASGYTLRFNLAVKLSLH